MSFIAYTVLLYLKYKHGKHGRPVTFWFICHRKWMKLGRN